MASGSFNLTRTGSTSSYITFTCQWSSVANESANTSTVTVKIIAKKSGSSTSDTYGNYTASANVGGSVQSVGSTSFRLSPNGSLVLLNKTFTVTHNSDGSKSVSITATVGGNVMSGSGSATVTLDNISRTPSDIASFTITAGFGNYVGLGDVITLQWSKPSGTVTGYEVQYQRGNSGWLPLKTTTGTTLTDSFTDTNFTYYYAGSPVQYRVRALNGSLAGAWKVSNILYISGVMNLKVGNVWKNGSTWINVNGVWKRAKRVWINVNGTWQYSK